MESSPWLIGAALLAAFVLYRIFKGYRSPRMLSEVAGVISAGAPLIDVRTREEFAQGHHPGALNIPLQELGGATERLGDRNGPVVVYCHSGSRSSQASRLLRSAGFNRVLDLGPLRNTRGLPDAKAAKSRRKIPSSKRRRRRR